MSSFLHAFWLLDCKAKQIKRRQEILVLVFFHQRISSWSTNSNLKFNYLIISLKSLTDDLLKFNAHLAKEIYKSIHKTFYFIIFFNFILFLNFT